MPHYQPGQNRYFGSMPRPVSSITSSILPFMRQSASGLGAPGQPASPRYQRPRRPGKPDPFILGKAERTDITKKLLKTPRYVPASTTKALKKFAEVIMKNKSDFSKEERVFAESMTHGDRVIKDESRQKKFIQGEVEALVATKDRRVTNPFAFTHRTEQVAGQTLRSIVKERHQNEQKQTPSQRRASLNIGRDSSVTPTDAPSTPGIVEPVKLGDSAPASAGQEAQISGGWTAPFAPVAGTGAHANTFHQGTALGDHGIQSSVGSDALIISDRVSEAILLSWMARSGKRLTRLPWAAAGLIKTLPAMPGLIVIDAAGPPPPSIFEGMGSHLVVFGVELTEADESAWHSLGAQVSREALSEESLEAIIRPSSQTNSTTATLENPSVGG